MVVCISSTEKPTEQLFETQNGFRDALTGAYIEMMSDKSYGEYLTMSKIEYLVDFWDPEKGSGEEALTLHRYSDAQAVTMIDALYEQQYKVILAVNAILSMSIFGKRSLIRERMKRKGRMPGFTRDVPSGYSTAFRTGTGRGDFSSDTSLCGNSD